MGEQSTSTDWCQRRSREKLQIERFVQFTFALGLFGDGSVAVFLQRVPNDGPGAPWCLVVWHHLGQLPPSHEPCNSKVGHFGPQTTRREPGIAQTPGGQAVGLVQAEGGSDEC